MHALFETENAALRAHNIAGVRDLATRKEKLTRLYLELMTSIARQADVLKTLEEDRRTHLKTLAGRLQRPAWKPIAVCWRPTSMPATA